jgi:hypothetical protein
MTETILASEPLLRLAMFLSVLAAMAGWELAAPRRRQDIPRVLRWTNNLALVVVDTIILRLTFPLLAVGLALIAQERGRTRQFYHQVVQGQVGLLGHPLADRGFHSLEFAMAAAVALH